MAINIKPANRGKLHKELGVPEGQNIPAKKLAKAADSSSPAERKRAVFAENAKKWNHSGGGGHSDVKSDRGNFRFRGHKGGG